MDESWLLEQKNLLSNSLVEAAEEKLSQFCKQRASNQAETSLERRLLDVWTSVQYCEVEYWKITLTEIEENLGNFIDGADRFLKAIESIYENGKGSIFSSITKFWSSEPQQSSADQFQLYMESAIAMGEINLMIASAHFRFHNYIRGGLHFRRGWKLFEEAYENILKRNPLHSEPLEKKNVRSMESVSFLSVRNSSHAQQIETLLSKCRHHHLSERAISSLLFDVGIYHFFLSLVPDSFAMLVEVIGFHADRDHGIVLLEECVLEEGYRSPAAILPLAVAYHSADGNWDRGVIAFKTAVEEYPDNIIYHYMLGIMSRQSGDMDLSSKALSVASEYASKRGYNQLHLTASYEAAHNDFLLLEWNKAAVTIEMFLRETKSKQFRAYGSFKLGLCYLMLGKVDEAVEIYEKLQEYVRPSMNFDCYARRRSQKYLKTRTITEFDKIYFQATFCNDAFKFETALGLVEGFADKHEPDGFILPDDRELILLYTKAFSLFKLNRFEESKEMLNKIILYADSVEDEKQIVPQTYSLLAEIALKESRLSECEYYLSSALQMKGYDFEKILRMHLKGLQKNLKNKRAAS